MCPAVDEQHQVAKVYAMNVVASRGVKCWHFEGYLALRGCIQFVRLH